MSIKWMVEGVVGPGAACTSQAIFYQIGNVGSALWSLTIAVHTFAILFLRVQVSSIACLLTLIGVWFVTGAIVSIGPALVQNDDQGPFHGPSGPWCWISEEYGGARLGLEYFWVRKSTLVPRCDLTCLQMFFSAFVCLLLSILVFVRPAWDSGCLFSLNVLFSAPSARKHRHVRTVYYVSAR